MMSWISSRLQGSPLNRTPDARDKAGVPCAAGTWRFVVHRTRVTESPAKGDSLYQFPL